MRPLQPYLIGTLFVVAGALHFRFPRAYEQIVPQYLPAHRELVAISGLFEILGGAGVMLPRTRTFAAWGLIALLIAVFPANLQMATDSPRYANLAPAWVFYARLPLQYLLIQWVYAACVRSERTE
jgi:uncharacterized membrane protein